MGFFTSIEGWGGSETFLRDLMLGVRAAGHDVVLLGFEGSRLAGEMQALDVECVFWRRGSTPDADMSAAPAPRKWKQFWLSAPMGLKLTAGNLRESWRLAKILKAAKLDALHVNCNGYEIAGLAGRLAAVPSVGCYLIVLPLESSLVRRLFQWITRWTYEQVVFQSEVGRDSVIKRAGWALPPCSIIPNGIEISDRIAHPLGPRSATEGYLLLSMARLHPMKGHADVIRAMALLKDRPITLDILGDGPEEKALQALIRELGVEGRVRLLGHVDRFADHLFAADGFVMASVSHESCPASLLLAMAAALPVVTSDLPALTEINQAGITGYVAGMGNSASIAESIRQLIDHPDDSVRLGIAGRERVIRVFSKAGMVKKWIELYEGVYAGGSARRRP